jgi:hypothetical protein
MAAKLCRSGGQPIAVGAKFCFRCGAAVEVSSAEQNVKKNQSQKGRTQQQATKSMEAKEREEGIHATYLGGFAGVTKQNLAVDIRFGLLNLKLEGNDPYDARA